MTPVDIDVDIEEAAWLARLPAAVALSERAARTTLQHIGGGAVAILLTSSAVVRDLNARFRGQDVPTNVLSFPAAPAPGAPLGDVALAFGVCEAEALAQGKPLADHLTHLIVHGVLHLAGYDHEVDSEAEAMESLEVALLAGLSIANPYDRPVSSVDDAVQIAASHG